LKRAYPFLRGILNTYALLFFSNSKLLAAFLLIISFFNPIAGLTGFCAVVIAIGFATLSNLYKPNIEAGLYSYNALFIGLGMGTFYNLGIAFFVLLFVTVLLSVVLSAVLQSRLSKIGLPFLSLPFILCFWLILLVTKELSAIDLTTRNIYWLNEMYALSNENLVRFVLFMENMNLPTLVATFLRALSSIFFQNNILAGLLIAIGVLLHSRILFSLLVIGFLTAYGFNYVVNPSGAAINNYLLGVNLVMVAAAIGGFFVIPSIYSYLWAIISVPIASLLVIALTKIMYQWLLPVYSLPFCITVLLLLYFFILRVEPKKIVLTPLQLYSPEKNLYSYLNNKKRLIYKNYLRLQLPFLGQWMVSQGHNGSITHKGDWSKALDFIIVDSELKTYSGYPVAPENFYCYNKPVVAPAKGFVQEIVDFIDDNEIGKVDKQQNWGNSIVIKHADGLYTKMSHLKKSSFKVAVGDYVKKGDIVAACGNSGRSPEPHLHFQVQATPFIGSKTVEYPIVSYVVEKRGEKLVENYKVPAEAELVSNVVVDQGLKQAFSFLPGYRLTVKAEGFKDEDWEVFTDAYNDSYIYCHHTKAIAYFEVNDSFFFFTSFYGDKSTLLYYFYVSAYRILLSTDSDFITTDQFPLQLSNSSILKWLQDLLAPFYIFSKLFYESKNTVTGNDIFNAAITINSRQVQRVLAKEKIIANNVIEISDNKISSFSFQSNHEVIKAICSIKG
jgi:urea transporter/murein DD-endopeptidase MepM/ murein hydrolase activator NlpD